MPLEMNSELEEKILRLKEDCTYILPMDEDAKREEVEKAKSGIKTSRASKRTKAKTAEKIPKIKKAQVDKEEVKAVKKHIPETKIPDENLKKDIEDEIEDEDFDEIVSTITEKKKNPEKPTAKADKQGKKEYIEAVINKSEKEQKKINMDLVIDNKKKQNAAPKTASNRVSVKTKTHVSPKKVVKPNTEDKSVEILKAKQLAEKKKQQELLKKKKQAELLKKKEEAKKQETLKKKQEEAKKKEETKKKVEMQGDLIKVNNKLPKSQQSFAPKKNIKSKTAQKPKNVTKQGIASSQKDKDDKIQNRKLNFNANKLKDAHQKSRKKRGIEDDITDIVVPENYQGDADFMKNIFNFSDSSKPRSYIPPAEKVNGFKVYNNSKPIKQQSSPKAPKKKEIKITPLKDQKTKEMYYQTLHENYNVKDEKIEMQKSQFLENMQRSTNENAYALYKQEEAERELQEKQQQSGKLNLLKDFKPKKK